MASIHQFPSRVEEEEQPPPALHDRAMDNLRFIRETMERAGSFTAVPGWGGVLMGVTALAAGLVSRRMQSRECWFVTWMVEAVVASAIGVLETLRKAKIPKTILQGPGRKFAMSLLPAFIG